MKKLVLVLTVFVLLFSGCLEQKEKVFTEKENLENLTRIISDIAKNGEKRVRLVRDGIYVKVSLDTKFYSIAYLSTVDKKALTVLIKEMGTASKLGMRPPFV